MILYKKFVYQMSGAGAPLRRTRYSHLTTPRDLQLLFTVTTWFHLYFATALICMLK